MRPKSDTRLLSVHISAQNRLSQYFPGRRSTIAMQDYKLPTTDMWPYLRWREEEVRTRRETFEKSFLGLYLNKKGLGIPISEKLWASLDDERQVVIAIRCVSPQILGIKRSSQHRQIHINPALCVDFTDL